MVLRVNKEPIPMEDEAFTQIILRAYHSGRTAAAKLVLNAKGERDMANVALDILIDYKEKYPNEPL